ncbi:clathrin heavy chain linker domain-containing protein 1-like isoform X2 [Watersipora subatra]|uniref:clathrin heavy chain linker domain-containing protein 1-like isoform X2 n=1 Tax=Watersipora subatra TaxID=2589382 RepID=UPI00355B3544
MSRSSSPPSPNTRYSVLPPVAKSDVDRVFLRELQQYMDNEMAQIDSTDHKQRYIIHSAAFSRLIDHVHAYKPLLTRVKKEYEDVVNAIERGKSEANYLNDKIQSIAQEPSTLRNYRRRHDELAKRIEVIRADNDKLKKELRELKAAKKLSIATEQQAAPVEKRKPKTDSRKIPGLTLEESTHIPTLQRELNKVENNIKELSLSKKSKFSDKQHKEDLKEKLTRKVGERDLLQQRNSWLIAKQKRLKVAHDAAMSYMNSKEPQYKTIADVIIMVLSKSKTVPVENQTFIIGGDKHLTSSHIEDDDPSKEKEAEMILEYIERFNELFEDGKYEEAAIHASNSPKGILRTMETMSRFKCVNANREGRSPWLAFCDAIMSSVLALGVKPSDTMSLECVSCALSENRLDLLSHWIAQDRLTVTEKLGDMISDHCKGRNRTYLDMAETIYRHCLAHNKVVNVMVRQGMYRRAIDYATEKGFTAADYMQLLTTHPSYQLGYAISEMKDESGMRLIPAGTVTRGLISADSHDIAMQILQKLFLKGPEETGSENNGLKMAVYNDHVTSISQWHDIVGVAQQYGYEEVAIDLLAAVTVQKIIKVAREPSGLSEKSTSELNFSSATSSRARQETGTTRQASSITEQTE